jgi:hypothetical protein
MEDMDKSKDRPNPAMDDEEDIIDLTSKVSSRQDDLDTDIDSAFDAILEPDDDEILELTQKAEPKTKDPDSFDEADTEEIIDLTHRVDLPQADEAVASKDDEGDDLLALLESALPAESPSDKDASPEALPEEDEEILELTDKIETPLEIPPSDMEAVIDLVDQVIPEQAESDVDDIIELTETVSVDDDADIVELVDPTPEEVSAADAPVETEPVMESGWDDTILDEILDFPEGVTGEDTASFGPEDESAEMAPAGETEVTLSDVFPEIPAKAGPPSVEDQAGKDDLLEISPPPQETEQIIQLGDILNGARRAGKEAPDDLPFDLDEALANDDMGVKADDTAGVLGIALDDIQSEARQEDERLSLSQQEIEDAVERLIVRKYGLSIEDMVANAVERIVSREIESIKRSFTENDEE